MPPRTGPNGAVIKPSSSTKSQRTARPSASNVIDLTCESTSETSENNSEEESPKEEEPESSEDAPNRHGKRSDGGRGYQDSSAGTQARTLGAGRAAAGRPKSNDRQAIPPHRQAYVLEDSFIVTSLHHRPWGAGDDNSTIGVFPTENEAKAAANIHFRQIERQADGWESEWRRLPGDGMLQLYGRIEEGEKDSETYKASVKRVQQKRPVAVQPRVPSLAQPKSRLVKPSHVYMVKEERTINLDDVDTGRGFQYDQGDLKAVAIHGIYMDLDAANASARKIYDGNIEDLAGLEDATTNTIKNGMVMILVDSKEDMLTYSICVEKKSLK